jgi:hypothetical protein
VSKDTPALLVDNDTLCQYDHLSRLIAHRIKFSQHASWPVQNVSILALELNSPALWCRKPSHEQAFIWL